MFGYIIANVKISRNGKENKKTTIRKLTWLPPLACFR
nr:MAG TPA: hypothetical protein [Caudoviricetes sp.]